MAKAAGKALNILSPVAMIGSLLNKKQEEPEQTVAPIPDDEARKRKHERDAAKKYGGKPRANTILSQDSNLG